MTVKHTVDGAKVLLLCRPSEPLLQELRSTK